MPIDPRIASSGVVQDPIDVTRGFRLRQEIESEKANREYRRTMQQQAVLKNERETAAIKREADKEAALAKILQEISGDANPSASVAAIPGTIPPTTDGNPAHDPGQQTPAIPAPTPGAGSFQSRLEKALPKIFAVSPKAGESFQKYLKEHQDLQSKRSKDALDLDSARVAFIAGQLYDVGDEVGYQRALNSLKSANIDTSSFPPQFDPAWVNQMRFKGLSISAQLEEKRKQAEDERNKGKASRDKEKHEVDLRKAKAEADMAEADAKEGKPTGDYAEFKKSYYPGWLEANGLKANAAHEFKAYEAWVAAKRARVPTPGVDIPLPADVESQRRRMNPPTERAGSFTPILDENGVITSFYNATTGESRPAPAGARRGALPTAVKQRKETIHATLRDLDILEGLAKKNEGSIGAVAGRFADVKRNTIGQPAEVNDLFRIADNLTDQLLRARSGAAITESEYTRLSRLLPNPRGPLSKFYSDLNSYRSEVRAMSDTSETVPAPRGNQSSGIPPQATPKSPAGGMEQYSESRKAYRHSMDGGKTWRPGRLPVR